MFAAVEAWVALLGLAAVIVTSATLARAVSLRAGFGAGAYLAIWFVAGYQLSRLGQFVRPGGSPYYMVPLVVVPILLAVPLYPYTRLPKLWLTRFQLFRVYALAYPIGWLGGVLPGWFALPLFAGDIAICATAWSGDRRPSWHVMGALLTAAWLAVAIAGQQWSFFLMSYPIAIIPAFLAPITLLAHILALGARESNATAP